MTDSPFYGYYRPITVDVWDLDADEDAELLWSGDVPALPDVGHQLQIALPLAGGRSEITAWTVVQPPLWVLSQPGGGPPPPHSVKNVDIAVRRSHDATPAEVPRGVASGHARRSR